MADDEEERGYEVVYIDEDTYGVEGPATGYPGKPCNWICRAGRARVTYENGDVFEGWYNSNGERHGHGKYSYVLPDEGGSGCYEGEWVQGKKHGTGTMKYPNGDVYKGQWNRDKRHGGGTYVYKNGDKYSGNWKNGFKNGRGAYVILSSKSQLIGVWENGKLKDGRWAFADGTVYSGEFERNQPSGKGLFTFPHGGQQEGYYAKPGDDDEDEDEDEETPLAPRIWVGGAVTNAVAPSHALNRAPIPSEVYVPSTEELALVAIESVTVGGELEGSEIIVIVNNGENTVNLKDVKVGSKSAKSFFTFMEDFMLESGKRLRVLSGSSVGSPPIEEEDVLNIAWGSGDSYLAASDTAELWLGDDAGNKENIIASCDY